MSEPDFAIGLLWDRRSVFPPVKGTRRDHMRSEYQSPRVALLSHCADVETQLREGTEWLQAGLKP